jgi:uncharacterized membrane protein
MIAVLWLTGLFSIVVGVLVMMVARGGIHEATAAILFTGGMLQIGMAVLIQTVRDKA